MDNMQNKPFPWLNVNRSGDTPIFQQIVDSIDSAVQQGTLGNGERLAPVRAMADHLGINALTVSRAYKELGARGLLVGRGPLGTFVTTDQAASHPLPEPAKLAGNWRSRYPEDTFRQMLDASALPGAISLTQAYPTASAVDLRPFERAMSETFAEGSGSLYCYHQPDGASALKDAVRNVLLPAQSGIDGPLLVTNGGQQAIALVMRALLRAGDTIVMERPSYFGALDVARSIGARIIGVDLEPDGLNLDQLSDALERHDVKLLFLMPNFHNPTGVTTSLDKRKKILELIRIHGVPVLEDDHAPEMRFRGEPLPSLRALARPEDPIFYGRGFGKSYVPGIRLGMVMPPPSYFQDIASQKSMTDLHTSWPLQEAFARYLGTPAARDNVERQCVAYARVQDFVIDKLKATLPPEFRFIVPDGGFNMWIETPPHIDSVDLCWAAAQRGVALLVGAPLFPDIENYQSFRLSYGIADFDKIESGIDRIGAAIRDVGAKRSRRSAPVV
ncbi:PLP-dependent aminotransferase family protein [Sphingobium sp. CR2-8]|uniref:aminotransferase-like domain-containing protein n=1 Tax=Sphingobium sp. CR2-8 TaxID=1306534 RepID=UPI002DBB9778|nr:PLP-dependent aminotransferase family protein [Sphingobium sp. CR2-8]MEC3909454.1 PLP-dependent aminotransferase family protein [Sphingobium sp. CR2-8]